MLLTDACRFLFDQSCHLRDAAAEAHVFGCLNQSFQCKTVMLPGGCWSLACHGVSTDAFRSSTFVESLSVVFVSLRNVLVSM